MWKIIWNIYPQFFLQINHFCSFIQWIAETKWLIYQIGEKNLINNQHFFNCIWFQFHNFYFSTDPVAEIIIYGVESEQVEEENDALNDMRAELGKESWAK